MARRRRLESDRSFCSGLSFLSSTPARSASSCRAPRLSVFSMSSTNVNTSPERSQPKQYHDCICGLTLKLGLSSWWKGHRPQKSLLRLLRRTCSCTTFTRSTLALTSAKASSDVEVGTVTIVIGHGVAGHRLDQGRPGRRRVRRRHDPTSALDGNRNGHLVTARGEGWRRKLDLRRTRAGKWSIRATADGLVALPGPGGEVADFSEALDCDLGLSPLTNSMPVLRHDLLRGGGPLDLLMAWVSVPDLSVHASRQRYTFVRAAAGGAVVRYESLDSGFTADITFDSEGLVIDYPGIGRRMPS